VLFADDQEFMEKPKFVLQNAIYFLPNNSNRTYSWRQIWCL